MRNVILIITGIAMLGFFNFAIYQKELILSNGEVVLLKLAPVDPRSMMQGNYMQLRYEIEEQLKKSDPKQLSEHQLAVIKPDSNNVAQFVRLYNNEPLTKEEKVIKFHFLAPTLNFLAPTLRGVKIEPNTFPFKEGLEPLYQNAAYAIFHYNGTKDYLLTGLADKERKEINPPQ